MSEENNTVEETVAEVETVFEEPSADEKQYKVVGSLGVNEDTVKRIVLTAISQEDSNKEFLSGETMCTFQWHTSKWDTNENLCTIVFSKPVTDDEDAEDTGVSEVEEDSDSSESEG